MVDSLHKIIKHYHEISGIHPACVAVPAISESDFSALCADVKQNGLRHEIVLTKNGELIDGRNRLRACYAGQVEPRFKQVATDPWEVAYSENIARRHLVVGQLAMFGVKRKHHEAIAARERQKGGQGGVLLVETFPEANGKSRDKAGEQLSISGKSIDKAEKILEVLPDVAEKVSNGELTLEAGYKLARKHESDLKSLTAENPKAPVEKTTTDIVTAAGVVTQIALPKKVVFNRTTDAVDWAAWTWNPVTGCEHGCGFCYAREIANSQRMAAYYPNKFEPTFHEYRLDAPKNTAKPVSDDEREGRVFVCSMADLFGKWVPDKWIKLVFQSCIDNSDWEYLFLTKWPARYAKMPLIHRAWYGASVIQQSDVKRVESAMQQFSDSDVVRWISLEPMLEPIRFTDLSWCNLVVIGSQTSTNQPNGPIAAFAPEFDWVVDVVNQCREAGVPYYLKANLGMVSPGMNLPKGTPS